MGHCDSILLFLPLRHLVKLIVHLGRQPRTEHAILLFPFSARSFHIRLLLRQNTRDYLNAKAVILPLEILNPFREDHLAEQSRSDKHRRVEEKDRQDCQANMSAKAPSPATERVGSNQTKQQERFSRYTRPWGRGQERNMSR